MAAPKFLIDTFPGSIFDLDAKIMYNRRASKAKVIANEVRFAFWIGCKNCGYNTFEFFAVNGVDFPKRHAFYVGQISKRIDRKVFWF